MPLLEQVLEKYPKDVKLVFKHFPLRNHQFARPAAQATIAAHKQGKFWEFHDALFVDYNKLNDSKIAEIAKALNLDMARYDKDRNSGETARFVEADFQAGVKAGVRGTPTIYLNGRLLTNRNLQGFAAAIDKELKKK